MSSRGKVACGPRERVLLNNLPLVERGSEHPIARSLLQHAEKWLVRRVREAAAPGHFSRVMGFVLAYMGQMRRIARPDGERDTGFLLWLRGEQGPARAAREAREAAQRAAAAAAPACVPLAAEPGRNPLGEAVEGMLAQTRQPPSAVGTVAVPLSLLSARSPPHRSARRRRVSGHTRRRRKQSDEPQGLRRVGQ